MRSCLPEEYRQLSKLKEDVFFGLVDYMSSEVLTHHAVPPTSVLVHLGFQIS